MKRLSSFIVLLLVALTSICQYASAQGFYRFGIKGGISIANLYGNDVNDTERRTGVDLGLFIAYSFNRDFALRLEALYSQKGAKLTGGSYDFIKYTLDYVDIPLLLQYNLPTEGQVRPYLCFGPALAIMYSARSTGQWSGLQPQPKEFIDFPRNTDIGLIFGAGAEFNVGERPLILEGRFSLGLSTIDPGERTYPSTALSGADIKNFVISLMIGYSLWH